MGPGVEVGDNVPTALGEQQVDQVGYLAEGFFSERWGLERWRPAFKWLSIMMLGPQANGHFLKPRMSIFVLCILTLGNKDVLETATLFLLWECSNNVGNCIFISNT